MKLRRAVCLLTTAASLLVIPSAWAGWDTTFLSTGPTVTVGEPNCAPLAGGQAMCVIRNQKRAMMYNRFDGTAWAGWKSLPGVVSSDISCGADTSGKLICGVQSATNTMQVTVFDGANWSSFVDSGYKINSAPSCAFLKSTTVFCAALSMTGGMVGSKFDGTTWGTAANAQGTLTTPPNCSSDSGANNVICIANGIINNLQTIEVNRFSGSKWDGYLELHGSPSGLPSCTPLGVLGQVTCFVRGFNTATYLNQFKATGWNIGAWTGWFALTGFSGPRASCGLVSSGSISCAFINLPDSLMYADTYTGTAWTGYIKVGQLSVGGPACTTLGTGRVVCVTVGIDGKVSSVTGP